MTTRANFLSGVFCVLPVPEHLQGKTVDVSLQRTNQAVKRVAVSLERLTGQFFEHKGRVHLYTGYCCFSGSTVIHFSSVNSSMTALPSKRP